MESVYTEDKSTQRDESEVASWLIGRLVKVSYEVGCGFIRAAGGALVYFSLGDITAESARLRPAARVRYRLAGPGIPAAVAVATL